MTKKPWEGDLLSPLDAVRLIIARTNDDGEQLAELIDDLSPIGRRALQVGAFRARNTPAENDYSRAFQAIRPAQKLLEGWMAQGQIGTVAGVERVAALDCRRREIDYERSALVRRGVAPVQDIAFERTDIERLCAPQPNEAAAIAGQPQSGPGARGISNEAAQPSRNRRITHQSTLVSKALEEMKSDGINVGELSNQKLVGFVLDRGVRVSADTILRVAGRRKWPVRSKKGNKQLP